MAAPGAGDLQWVAYFKSVMASDGSVSTAVAAMQTLLAFLQQSDAETLSELRDSVKSVIDALTQSTETTITSVASGCELFLRFITLKAEAEQDFAKCKLMLIQNGQEFLAKAKQSRQKIAPKAVSFIRDGATVLTLSRSRVVQAIFLEALKRNKHFSVIVTETRPSCQGHAMATWLKEHGIPVTVIADAAVGYVIERVDFVIVGAEAVVESGGIINSIGTYQTAIAAKAVNIPFYAVAESFKFVRLFPLSQQDLPPQQSRALEGLPEGVNCLNPLLDYTPPALVTLLFSELGVLTPSAVSDELIKLYC